MKLLDRLRRGGRGPDKAQQRRIRDATERLLAISPQLRLARRHEQKLAQALEVALSYLDALLAMVPPAREASAAAWGRDPYIHAFFASADDVAPALSRSPDLCGFFERCPDVHEAYGVLGMAMVEKHVLGVALHGETLRSDVVRLTLSFSDHRVPMCGMDEADLREEVVHRLVDQLGLEGLTRFAADQSRREVLEQERALLRTRLRILESQGVGVRGAFGDQPAAGIEELARLREDMLANERSLEELGVRSEALDQQLGHLCAVLADPERHLYVESRRFRLNRMNVVVPPDSAETAEELSFQVARVPTDPPRLRAFAIVRFARADLLASGTLYERASKLLG
ncbi:MAG: hypothetical protein ACXWC6_14605 [Ramlibacter sp.]